MLIFAWKYIISEKKNGKNTLFFNTRASQNGIKTVFMIKWSLKKKKVKQHMLAKLVLQPGDL